MSALVKRLKKTDDLRFFDFFFFSKTLDVRGPSRSVQDLIPELGLTKTRKLKVGVRTTMGSDWPGLNWHGYVQIRMDTRNVTLGGLE